MALLINPTQREEEGRQIGSRTRLLFGVLLFLLLAPVVVVAQNQTPPTDYQVKAAFLFNFAKFVEWPASKLPANAPVIIAVLGSNPFGTDLEKVVGGKQALGHPIEFRYVDSVDELLSAHIAFISTSERRRMKEILERLSTEPILTVGESEDFCQEGGVIRFRTIDGKVRLEVNTKAAARQNLKVSSRLLTVAAKVWK